MVGSDQNNHSSPREDAKVLSHTGFVPTPIEKSAHELVSAWCAAYRRSDTKGLAALETGEFEIVDRFGDWHDLIGLKARKHFWAEGFAMIRREEFSPQCTVQRVRLTRWNGGFAQVTVSYNKGIALEGERRVTRIGTHQVEYLAKDTRNKQFVSKRYTNEEFVDTLIQHVPDRGRHAMRYFGLLSPRSKARVWAGIFVLLNQRKRPHPPRLSWRWLRLKTFGSDPLQDSLGQPMHWIGRRAPCQMD
jgi:hypothetical protein